MTDVVNGRSGSRNWSTLALPIAAIATVFVMLVPVPAAVLDILLGTSIAAAVLLFLTAVRVRRAVDLSVFPTLLLLLTLFRLSLNLASSRRILLHGHEGTAAAGGVIEAFGQFVVGGNYVVGFVLFLALTAIQFLVISHGAVRTAEVTARFTLDALPGKQMAIDADMNAGLIDEAGARRRREAIAREAEFYGSMDGAARFSQRDAMATILITAINIVAGLLIGVLQQGVDLMTALKTYTVLTVGDGLVTMVPSLLVSIAGGLVLTRAASAGSLDRELGAQLLRRRSTIWLAAGVMCALALVPGLPKMAFLIMATGLWLWGRTLPADDSEEELLAAEAAEKLPLQAAGSAGEAANTVTGENLQSLIRMDELSLEIGFQLIPLVDEKQGGQMLNRVRAMRRQLATELGFVVPAVHIADNLRLRPREYVLSLRGAEIARWQMEGNCVLAVAANAQTRALPGVDVREPAFGVAAKWIQPGMEDAAFAAGYSVVDQTALLATHMAEMVKRHAHELLGRAETKRLLDSLTDSHPKLVDELVPKLLSLGEVQRVLQQLLREGVSIRDLGTILESLTEAAVQSRQTVHLVECARQALGRGLVRRWLDADGSLRVLQMSAAMEQDVLRVFDAGAAVRPAGDAAQQPAETLRRLLQHVKTLTGSGEGSAMPVLLCPSPARFHLRRWLESTAPKLQVMALQEIPPEVRVRAMGTVG